MITGAVWTEKGKQNLIEELKALIRVIYYNSLHNLARYYMDVSEQVIIDRIYNKLDTDLKPDLVYFEKQIDAARATIMARLDLIPDTWHDIFEKVNTGILPGWAANFNTWIQTAVNMNNAYGQELKDFFTAISFPDTETMTQYNHRFGDYYDLVVFTNLGVYAFTQAGRSKDEYNAFKKSVTDQASKGENRIIELYGQIGPRWFKNVYMAMFQGITPGNITLNQIGAAQHGQIVVSDAVKLGLTIALAIATGGIAMAAGASVGLTMIGIGTSVGTNITTFALTHMGQQSDSTGNTDTSGQGQAPAAGQPMTTQGAVMVAAVIAGVFLIISQS